VIEGPVVVLGDPVPVIASYATKHGIDLIVLGTRGLGLDAVGRLGSVSAGVANLVDTPILLVPPAVWQTYAPTS
jgi:nucleotide-binding universal stress UspA family protein